MKYQIGGKYDRIRRFLLALRRSAAVAFFFLFAVPWICSAAAVPATPPPSDLTPKLSVPIPTLPSFSQITVSGPNGSRVLGIDWMAQYVSAAYRFGIGIAALLATVMMMIGGLQYLTAGGDAGRVSAAKEKISDALIGLALSVGVYAILSLVNPDIVKLKALQVVKIEPQALELNDNETPLTGSADVTRCVQTLQDAISSGLCRLPQKIKSPTESGSSFSCNYHFSQSNFDFSRIAAVDFSAPFGSAIKAPTSGTVTYIARTAANVNACGNTIVLTVGSAAITICHAKDFLDASGNPVQNGKQVNQGDVIGHVGGACCQGETPDYGPALNVLPSGWCNKPGPKCADPYTAGSCQCQDWMQSGYTSGPHIHLGFQSTDSNLLACMQSAGGQ